MDFRKIAETVKAAALPATVSVTPQKHYIKYQSPGGALVYVQRPGKSGAAGHADVSHWRYGEELPPCCERIDNGAVAYRINLDEEGGMEHLAEVLALLPDAKAEASPKGKKGRTSGAPVDDLALLGIVIG